MFHMFTFIFLALLTVAHSKDRPLEGLKLRCCTLRETPIIIERNRTGLGFEGIGIDYLGKLEQKLGFRCETLKLFSPRNNTIVGFNGFVKMLAECTLPDGTIRDDEACQCDLGVAGWVQTEERQKHVLFVPPFLNNVFGILTHIDNLNADHGGSFFFQAFSLDLWLCIASLVLLFSFLKVFGSRFEPPGEEYVPLHDSEGWWKRAQHWIANSEVLRRMKRALKSTMNTIIGQTDGMDNNLKSCWSLNYIILISGLILILSYEASMTTFLLRETYQSKFRSIEDLTNCRIEPERLCIPADGVAQVFWQKAVQTSYVVHHIVGLKQEIFETDAEECDPTHCSTCYQDRDIGSPIFVKTYEEGAELLRQKKCDYFLLLASTMSYFANGRYCGELVATGEPFFTGGLSFLLPKNSSLGEAFTAATLGMAMNGQLDTIEQFMDRQGIAQCWNGRSTRLNFHRLRFFFVTIWIACALVFLGMIVAPGGKRRAKAECTSEKSLTYSVADSFDSTHSNLDLVA